MPSPMYNNAFLRARQPGPDYTVDVMHDPAEQARRKNLAEGKLPVDPVADAKAYGETAPDYGDIASIPKRLQEAGQFHRPSIRDLTAPLATAGNAAALASLPMLLSPAAPYAGAVGALGTAASVPDMLARSFDDDPSNDPDVLEGGMTALGLLPGVGKSLRQGPGNLIRGERTAGEAASRMGAGTFGTELPYQAAPSTTNPNQILGVARDIAGETGDPLEKVLASGRQNGLNRASQQALSKLANSGTRKVAAAPPVAPGDWLDDTLAAGRGTGYTKEAQTRGAEFFGPPKEDAWSALRKLMTRHESVPNPEMDLSGEVTNLTSAANARHRAERMREYGAAFRGGRPLRPEF